MCCTYRLWHIVCVRGHACMCVCVYVCVCVCVAVSVFQFIWNECECAGLWTQWMWKELSVSYFGRGSYSVKVILCTHSYCIPSSLSFLITLHSTNLLNVSLFQLWPLFGGRMIKPRKSKLFYIPQVCWWGVWQMIQCGNHAHSLILK